MAHSFDPDGHSTGIPDNSFNVQTPLEAACSAWEYNLPEIKELVENGANPFEKNRFHVSPFEQVIFSGKDTAVEYFLSLPSCVVDDAVMYRALTAHSFRAFTLVSEAYARVHTEDGLLTFSLKWFNSIGIRNHGPRLGAFILYAAHRCKIDMNTLTDLVLHRCVLAWYGSALPLGSSRCEDALKLFQHLDTQLFFSDQNLYSFMCTAIRNSLYFADDVTLEFCRRGFAHQLARAFTDVGKGLPLTLQYWLTGKHAIQLLSKTVQDALGSKVEDYIGADVAKYLC